MFNVEVPFENGKHELITEYMDEEEQMNEDRQDNEHEHGPFNCYYPRFHFFIDDCDNIFVDECPFFFYFFNM